VVRFHTDPGFFDWGESPLWGGITHIQLLFY